MNNDASDYLSVFQRLKQLRRIEAMYPNVEIRVIDCSTLKRPDGTEDWDAETPLVRHYLPKIDYVYSSEPEYDEYFSRAYPEAEHVIVDAERIKYPISGTLIRAMETLEEKEKWMV